MYEVVLYARPSGASPVEDYVNSQDPRTRVDLQREFRLLGQLGPQASDTRHLRGKIWELRVRSQGKHHRILYFVDEGRIIVLLIGFTKKTTKTPRRIIELAEEHREEYLSHRS